jgi:hypothetical protein
MVDMLSLAQCKCRENEQLYLDLLNTLLTRPTPDLYAEVVQLLRSHDEQRRCDECGRLTGAYHEIDNGETLCGECHADHVADEDDRAALASYYDYGRHGL